jgi:hypothetical protein
MAYQVKEKKARHDEEQEIQGHKINGKSHDEWNDKCFHFEPAWAGTDNRYSGA